MKKYAKTMAVLAVLVVLIASLAACGYNAVKATEDVVVVTISEKVMPLEGKTLADYLNKLQADGKITYSADNGFITTVNGKTADYAKDQTSWMIYTSDKEMGNESWGTYEYEGKIYYSAVVGIGDYPLTEGVEILLVFCKF